MAVQETYLVPGNWQKFDSFAWFDCPDDADEFALVYTHNRDSELIDQSNARIIAAKMAEFDECDVIPQSHSHWACGWIEGFAIRVYRNGELTEAAQAWDEFQAALEDYPILDESDYSELECEAQSEAWENWVRHEFERALDRKFDCEFDLDADKLYEIFHAELERGSAYWDGDSIDVDAIVRGIDADDMIEFAPAAALRVYLDGEYFADCELVLCGELVELRHDVPLYAPELELVENAIIDESESADNGRLTWTIEY